MIDNNRGSFRKFDYMIIRIFYIIVHDCIYEYLSHEEESFLSVSSNRILLEIYFPRETLFVRGPRVYRPSPFLRR